MFFQSTIVILLAATAIAAPASHSTSTKPAASAPTSSTNGAQTCEHGYKVEKWGKTVTQSTWDSSKFGTFKGCADSKHSQRDTTSTNGTTIEVDSQASIHASWPAGSRVPYDALWTQIHDVCHETFCDGQKQTSVLSGGADDEQLIIQVDANYPDAKTRDYFLHLIQASFHKGTNPTSDPTNTLFQAVGPGVIHVTTTQPEISAFWMTMRMNNQTPKDDFQCPGVVTAMADIGSLNPELAPVFGVVSAFCDAMS